MSQTWLLILIPCAVVFYGVVCVAIGWQMRGHADEILPDAEINRDATPPEQFPNTAQWAERNHLKVLR